MNLVDLAEQFSDSDKARKFLEAKLWPDGPVCPHCGLVGEAYKLTPTAKGKTHVRQGVWKCSGCRKEFTVTVGTIFEDSHIPLHKWLMAIHLICASKKGMSAHQLHRMLGVTYKSAWFMAHRIRYAMAHEANFPLSGEVEADETYIGGKQKGQRGRIRKESNKSIALSLVQRKGHVRSFVIDRVTSKNLREALHANVDKSSHVMTDEFRSYRFVGREFKVHGVVRHSDGEYAFFDGNTIIHTNTVEGYFSILKRGINGVYHHVGKQHLHRYLSEFDFRYNSRDVTDGERASEALKGFAGKRLTYRTRAYSQN